MSEIRKKYIEFLVVLSIFVTMGFTFQIPPKDNDDQKKLEKVKEINQEAQKLNDEANSLYSEIAEYDDSDPKNTEIIEKLKNKALKFQLEALELQKEANFIEYNVLNNNLAELKSKYSINNDIPIELKIQEEQAGELFYKAEKLRNEAYLLEKDELEMRFSKLSGAQEYERTGIESLEQLKDIFAGNQTIETNTYSNPNAGENDKTVEINEELLKSFLNYLNRKDSFLTVNKYYSILYSDSITASSIRNAWDDYLYADISSTQTDEAYETGTDDALNIPDEVEPGDISADLIEDDIEKTNTDIYKDVIFKIQVAADKSQLPQHSLQKIYEGNKTVKMINENGWNKYSIGDFKSYAEADVFRGLLKVGDAFIVAYKDGTKIDTPEMLKEQKRSANKEISSADISGGVIFKVQIAADKVKLSENQLAAIYGGNEPVALREEDGWYKYSVGTLNTYEQAVALNKSTHVKGSFVVAFRDGIRIPLNDARKGKLSETSLNEDIVFKVQVAADKKQLSSEKLHVIYSGYEKINRFEEDGWYKYAVGEFNNFNDANEFRKNCNVKGAFVVAFKGDKKINVLDAKKSLICHDPIIHKDWMNNSELVFKVQIAASSEELPVNKIKKICCIEPDVYLIEENGWFKYSIGNFKLYQNALELKNNSRVDGAFVVAYKNGQKINIKEAIEISKK
ncbi:MAG: hypothetical protein A2X13_02635 [Bacteroidetes bacterium GWC2_33_15]|nr:MAG: hypothetical protein A2X10_15080 [Bacteroidetes bacterium GWA2_33_15]OFX49386.1 MAG: hypothetical protein A2X13_02635 [Bacteroidetes bacterium GWC2_33_15]OFX63021.1 MAG: hypothetical protein A2X15_10240 [Bacteroidetes bacterium GWB2_32_14]OFX68734.1 MAG: hypothetical protein A2X14_14160 [Bacteroidetes bacterium GWD2_33_33]HAN19094.1 hypothetical protein [Bacteroidales bacterium]